MNRGVATEQAKGAVVVAALGIVFGDLGTSPLYTYQTIVGAVGGRATPGEALGLLSLVVWALLITVSLKYCIFVMRADNHGEGGILALMSLVTGRVGKGSLVAMALFGAALIYGDGMITPAISVLSALEGINVITDSFKPYIVPAALVVLLALFAAQMRGTASIGRVFGPVMLIWFLVIAALGISGIVRQPHVLVALDPRHAIRFLATHGRHSLLVLGGVFLAITGGEALYADMGHFGRAPIRLAWFFLVLPALLLSYAGQTALLLERPNITGNPFFLLAPSWAIVPLVLVATLATIIASQAIITGAFSLTRQAMQLGWFPGVRIAQTSDTEYGQIYVPFVNWAMMVGTLALTYGFGSSDALAGAYGTAVSTTMLLTTALLYNAMRDVWGWNRLVALLAAGFFLVIDLGFFAANMMKLREGGWIPLALGMLIFVVMTTWRHGVEALKTRLSENLPSPEVFLATLEKGAVARVPGTAVFLTRGSDPVPTVMVRHAEQMKALQEVAVALTIQFTERPRVAQADRAEVLHIAHGLWHISVQFGFMEIPNLTTALAAGRDKGCPLDLHEAIYFAAADEVVAKDGTGRLPAWRRLLFAFMYRNAVRAPDRFALPADRFVEVGRQIAL